MIDAAFAAAMAAPAAPAGEPAPAEGFGDLLTQMLATTEGEAAPTDTVTMEALVAAQAAAQAVATPAVVPAQADAATSGKAGAGHDESPVESVVAMGKAGAGRPESPEAAATGKAASAAWHASPVALAHASAHSAVVLAAAAQAAAEAARQAPVQGGADTAASPPADLDIPGPEAIGPVQGETVTVEVPVTDSEPAEPGLPSELETVRSDAETPARPEGGDATLARAETPAGAERFQVSDVAGSATQAPSRPRRAAERAAPVAATNAIDGSAPRPADAAAHTADVHPAGPSVELFASGALRRVMEAIEAAEHRPPPNTMAVEIPGEGAEGALRLMVSVRGTVVEITTQGERVLPPGWARPLADALAERGLSLDGFGARDAATGGQDAAGQSREDRSAREDRAAGRRFGAQGTAHRQFSSTGNDGALRL